MAVAKLTSTGAQPVDINEEPGRANFFQSCVERMLTYWREHDALKNLDVSVLDRERNRILKNITLGLDLQPLWPLVKALVLAFAPYMERRGFWDTWHSVLEQAIRMAQRADDREAETTLTAFLARLCQRMSRTADVVRHYRRVIQLARQTDNRFEEARACSNLGYLYIDGRRWWRSEVLSQHALAIFEELGSTHGRAHTNNHLGLLYTRTKSWKKAEAHLHAAKAIWEGMDDLHGIMRAHGNLGLLYNEMDQLLDAIEHSKLALHYATITGEESISGTFMINIAVSHRKQGNRSIAQYFAEKAEKIFLKFSDRLQLAYVWHQLALLHLQHGMQSEAEYYKVQTIAIYRQYKLMDSENELENAFSQ